MADANQPNQPPAFALVPGAIQGVIDFSTRQGLAIYSAATRPLYEDPADSFNVESPGLQTFLALLRLRAITSGWDLEVPQDVTDPHNNLLDMTTNHGRLSLEHLRDFCVTFVNLQSRAAQENIQIVKCIMSSLTLPGFRKVQTWHSDWHIGDRPCAFLLIKVLIRESYIDTQATTRILREHLSSLPAKLEEMKGDIDQFNGFVKVTMDQLAARGETTQDLLANLFKGYLSCRDATFRKYIEKKQEDYDDGVAFTADGLMTSASNKYKILVQSGKWMALSAVGSFWQLALFGSWLFWQLALFGSWLFLAVGSVGYPSVSLICARTQSFTTKKSCSLKLIQIMSLLTNFRK